MMNFRFVSILFFAFGFSSLVHSQVHLESWKFFFKGAIIRDAITLADGNLLVTGQVKGITGHEMFLMKTDTNAVPFWTKSYGGVVFDDYNPHVQELPGGDLLVTLVSYSFGSGDAKIQLLKTDANGNLIRLKNYGGSSLDMGGDISEYPPHTLPLSNGSFLTSGTTVSFGLSTFNGFLFNTDSSGHVNWSYTFGNNTENEYFFNMKPARDGNIFIIGSAVGFPGYNRIMISKLDTLGNVLWAQTVADSFSSRALDIVETSSGDLYVFGLRRFEIDKMKPVVVKTDSMGNLRWAKHFWMDGDIRTYGHQASGEESFLFSGVMQTDTGKFSIMYRMDTSGTITWRNATPHSGPSGISKVLEVGSGNLLLLGSEADSFPTLREFARIILMRESDTLCSSITWTDSLISYLPTFVPHIFDVDTVIADTISGTIVIQNHTPTDSIICLIDCFADASFTLSDTSICAGESVIFDAPGKPIRFSEWKFNSTVFSTAWDTLRIFYTPGTYTIQHKASNGYCTDSVMMTLTVVDTPRAYFSFIDSSYTVSFTDSSSGTIVSWSWDFADSSAMVSDTNPVHTYATAGTFNVCLTVVNDLGCADTIYRIVNIRSVHLDESAMQTWLDAWPNPARDKIHFAWNGPSGPLRISIFEMSGRLIQTHDWNGIEELTIPLQSYPDGIYIVRVEHEGNYLHRKVIVAKN